MKIIVILILLALAGCATPKVEYITEYRDVLKPIPCDVPIPERPPINSSTYIMAVDVLKYVETLEIRLYQCMGVTRDER
jgi:hypothetical protein